MITSHSPAGFPDNAAVFIPAVLETLANLAVSFTVLFYCKALHFSRMQSQISQQKKELCELFFFCLKKSLWI